METKNHRRNVKTEPNEMIMQLWTIIDGDIYLEENIQPGSGIGFRMYPEYDMQSFINPYHID